MDSNPDNAEKSNIDLPNSESANAITEDESNHEIDGSENFSEYSDQEKVVILEGIIESLRISIAGLNDDLSHNDEMLGLAREDRDVYLAAITNLNKRIEQLSQRNRNLEYDLDVTKRLYSIEVSRNEALELRAIKAEDSLCAAKMQAVNWRERHNVLLDRLSIMDKQLNESGTVDLALPAVPVEQQTNNINSDREVQLERENATLKRELDHMKRTVDLARPVAPVEKQMNNINSEKEVQLHRENATLKRELDHIKRRLKAMESGQNVMENPFDNKKSSVSSSAVHQQLPSTSTPNVRFNAKEENLMAILRPYHGTSGYVLNMDSSLIRLFSMLNEAAGSPEVLEIENRLFRWNVRCQVCCVSIPIRTIRNLFEHIMGGNHRLSMSNIRSGVSQAAFNMWETELREAANRKPVQEGQCAQPPQTQEQPSSSSLRSREVWSEIMNGCTVKTHTHVPNVIEIPSTLNKKWNEIDAKKRRELAMQFMSLTMDLNCDLCKTNTFHTSYNFFSHLGSSGHLQKMLDRSVKVCVESLNAIIGSYLESS